MSLLTKIKSWWKGNVADENSVELMEEVQTTAFSEEKTVEKKQVLSEAEQQLLQIRQFIESDELSNHELAAMFMLGLEMELDKAMIETILQSAEKLIFWVNREDNSTLVNAVITLSIGPRFFSQYADIALFAEVLPKFTAIEELRWKAKHLWNQHPILIAAAQLPRLKRLYAENCRMNYFPESVCQAPQLEALYLSGNKLKDMPQQLEQLMHLKILDLSNNAFTKCPRSVCKLKLLEVLHIQGNPLTEIEPRMLGRLYKLRDFQLPSAVAKRYLEDLKDWLPDVDFDKPYWQIEN